MRGRSTCARAPAPSPPLPPPTPWALTLPGRGRSPPARAVEELLLWRDPKKSGAVLGGATLAFVVLQFARFNVIATLAYAVMSVVLGAFIWNNIASFTKK